MTLNFRKIQAPSQCWSYFQHNPLPIPTRLSAEFQNHSRHYESRCYAFCTTSSRLTISRKVPVNIFSLRPTRHPPKTDDHAPNGSVLYFFIFKKILSMVFYVFCNPSTANLTWCTEILYSTSFLQMCLSVSVNVYFLSSQNNKNSDNKCMWRLRNAIIVAAVSIGDANIRTYVSATPPVNGARSTLHCSAVL